MPSSGGRSLGSNIERQLGCFKQINAGGAYSCMNEAQVVRNSWSAVLNGGKRLIAVIHAEDASKSGARYLEGSSQNSESSHTTSFINAPLSNSAPFQRLASRGNKVAY